MVRTKENNILIDEGFIDLLPKTIHDFQQKKANLIKLSWWPDLGYSRLTNPGTVHHCEIATMALRGVKKRVAAAL